MKISRAWAMPNKNTFSIKPIGEMVGRLIEPNKTIIDPFTNKSPFAKWCITNDIDKSMGTQYNMEALDFLKMFDDDSVHCVLFDPPYSPRQVSECYKKFNMTVNMQTTQSSFWSNMKKEIGRIVKNGGCVLTCGWNSGGIGKKYGFEIQEVLIVAHGGWHNDTIVTLEVKI